jgi:hypothetical protein
MARTNNEILAQVYETYGLDLVQRAGIDNVIVRMTLMAMNLAREDQIDIDFQLIRGRGNDNDQESSQ